VTTRQVRLIHKGKMTPKDVRQCTDAIRKNAVECMQAVLQAMGVHAIALADAANAPAQARMLALTEESPFGQVSPSGAAAAAAAAVAAAVAALAAVAGPEESPARSPQSRQKRLPWPPPPEPCPQLQRSQRLQ
jgi:hypothetical protein